jgi:hypothetical protein
MLNFLANNPWVVCCGGLLFWTATLYIAFTIGRVGSPVQWIGFRGGRDGSREI